MAVHRLEVSLHLRRRLKGNLTKAFLYNTSVSCWYPDSVLRGYRNAVNATIDFYEHNRTSRPIFLCIETVTFYVSTVEKFDLSGRIDLKACAAPVVQ